MSSNKTNRFTWRQPLILALLMMCFGIDDRPAALPQAPGMDRSIYIVRASSIEAAAATVSDAGGIVVEQLSIINAVGAAMTAAERLEVASSDAILGVHSDARLELQASEQDSHYPRQVGARDAHDTGLTGRGVTIAVLDTGLWQTSDTKYDTRGRRKISATHDATQSGWSYCDEDDEKDEGDDDCYSSRAKDCSWNRVRPCTCTA